MQNIINAKTLRSELGEILERARSGERFIVLHRSRPVCQIVPLDEQGREMMRLEDDPLYGAEALGRSADGKTAADHDQFLYRSSEE